VTPQAEALTVTCADCEKDLAPGDLSLCRSCRASLVCEECGEDLDHCRGSYQDHSSGAWVHR
jgi:predicted amidophosphoribosyltransferase